MNQGTRGLVAAFETNVSADLLCPPGDANERAAYATSILANTESHPALSACATPADTTRSFVFNETSVPMCHPVGTLTKSTSPTILYGHFFDSYDAPNSHRWAPYPCLASQPERSTCAGFFRTNWSDLSDSDSASTDISHTTCDFVSVDDDASLDPSFSTLLSDVRPLSELKYECDCILPDSAGPETSLSPEADRADSVRRNNLPSSEENINAPIKMHPESLSRGRSDGRGSHSIERVGLRRLLYLSSRVHKNREIIRTDAEDGKKPMETYVQSFRISKFAQQRPRRKGPKLFAACGHSSSSGALSESILEFDLQN
eukprot:TRINITY_DN12850_c0_g1_i1.p1 TRINITY_DN12850_c0_g1~~TRINITY_DN12850_c0_g1_i1.p1  ORF type:complete len:316 (+),score=17.57 TRINITY_DN12850_c0_g1_i1:63-1010(+)